MPTIIVNITDVTRVKNNVSFKATSGDAVIERTLNVNTVDNWDDFAQWLLDQQPDYDLLPDKEKSLSITFHTETLEGVTRRVLDSVIVSPLL